MDVRDTPEQAELRRTARQLARELGPRIVADLDDETRSKSLAGAVRDAGWLEVRHDVGDGAPLARGGEAAIIADAPAGGVADAAFAGPVLAADLARRAGSSASDGAVVAFSSDLIDAAVVSGATTGAPIYAVDCAAENHDAAYVLVPDGSGYRLALVRVDRANDGADLTRRIRAIRAGTAVSGGADRGRTPTREGPHAGAAPGPPPPRAR